jgi:hypothetical protein
MECAARISDSSVLPDLLLGFHAEEVEEREVFQFVAHGIFMLRLWPA